MLFMDSFTFPSEEREDDFLWDHGYISIYPCHPAAK
jgi:hypothetical protein